MSVFPFRGLLELPSDKLSEHKDLHQTYDDARRDEKFYYNVSRHLGNAAVGMGIIGVFEANRRNFEGDTFGIIALGGAVAAAAYFSDRRSIKNQQVADELELTGFEPAKAEA